MNTSQIIKSCISNDRKAQRELYELHAERLMNICLRYSYDTSEAKDILQNTFIKIFTKIASFDSKKGDFKNWSARIAINEALQHRRRDVNNASIEYFQPIHDRPVEAAIYSELGTQAIFEIIKNLPEGFRIVFNLYVVEGFSHKEIADILHISEGTSRSQLQRARLAIQKKLSEESSKIA